MVKHCATCECEDTSSIRLLDTRIHQLLQDASHDHSLCDLQLPSTVAERMRPRPDRYSMGFTGLKLSSSTTVICGQFLAALYPLPFAEWNREEHDEPRYFVVNTLNPVSMGMIPGHWITRTMEPIAHEYLKGDCFDISNSPFAEEIQAMNGWSDERLAEYLFRHLIPLRDIVVDAAFGEPVAHV